jgi:Holliday junction DNA helicase RuvA
MIVALRGTLVERLLDRVAIDVGGVSYGVFVSLNSLADLPALGREAKLLCYTHVREDSLLLYGFSRAEERDAFQALITVSGVGPKLALTVLSGIPVAQLISAIAASDYKRLTVVPGVGKKTAERLVVELKDKFAKLALASMGQSESEDQRPPMLEDILEALVGLGYKRTLAERTISRLIKEGAAAREAPELLLRRALALIAEP